MKSPDISIVLNAHREGTLLSYTLRSLVDTALHAKARGLAVELVAVLDNADAATRAVLSDFDTEVFSRIEKLEVCNGSLGPSRNAGLRAARGAFTATVDGDDLYSFNYLASMHAAAASGGLVVALPSLCIWFDSDWMVLRFEPLSRIGRFRLAGAHTFMSCILAPTTFLRDLGYRDCAGGRTFAYEDWDLNCRAVAAGADIRTADDAALFYRRHARSIMAGIGDVRRIVPPNAFFDPETLLAGDDGGAIIDDAEALRPALLALRGSNLLAELVAHANAIDPRIDLAKLRTADVWTNAMFSRDFGATYHALCRELGAARFDCVLIADTVAAASPALRRLIRTPRRWLAIETAGTEASIADGVEANRTIALDLLGRLLPERRAEMIVRLIHAFADGARLHLVLGGDCGVSVAFAEAFADHQIVLHVPAGATSTLPPDTFLLVDLLVFDVDEAMHELVAREPVFAMKADVLPAFGDAEEAAGWLAALDARLTFPAR